MYLLHIILILVVSCIGLFFLGRSILTILSFFSKSPFVPLEKVLIEKALGFLKIDTGDRFLDIGSGDGRVVLECASRYPKAKSYTGIEIIPILVVTAKLRKFLATKDLKKKDILLKRQDASKYHYGNYNKVYMYLLPEFVQELMVKLEKELPKNAIVVSVAFAIPDVYKKSGELKMEEVKFGRKKKKIYIWKKK